MGPDLSFASGKSPGPWGLDDKGPRLIRLLNRHRERVKGLSLVSGDWLGATYYDIKTAVYNINEPAGGVWSRDAASRDATENTGDGESGVAATEVREPGEAPIASDSQGVSGVGNLRGLFS